jgi:GPH family glycoside/pentoside/hexuronide:cation symporter
MEFKKHHITDAEDKISFFQKVGFGMGSMARIISVNSVNHLTMLIYNIGLGVNPVLLGIAQSVPRIWDGFTDPIVGSISDNSRSRFGRRIPFILIGGILLGIFFSLLWLAPRGWGQYALFAYFLIMSLLFYTAFTLVDVPHGALGYEMTNDYHERTRLFAYASFLGSIGALTIPWLYYLANLSIFKDEVEGIRWVGIVMGAFMIIATTICALVCKETKLKQVKTQEKVKFWQNVTMTFKNRTFVWLIGVIFLVTVGFYLVSGFNNYITIYYLYSGDKKAASVLLGWCGTLWSVASLAGVFLMTWVATRIGKAKTVLVFLLIMAAGNLLKIVCYNRTYPWLVLIPTLMLSLGFLVLFSLVYAMIADICDEDELKTGKRREGSYHAVYGWWFKVGISGAYFVAGFLLKGTGFDADLPTQSESTLFWLRFWEIGLPSLMCLLSALLLSKYPLTEKRVYEIKELLKQRRELQSSEKGENKK